MLSGAVAVVVLVVVSGAVDFFLHEPKERIVRRRVNVMMFFILLFLDFRLINSSAKVLLILRIPKLVVNFSKFV